MTDPGLPLGWLTDDEAACLAELARGKRVVEVGSFLGRSTIVMARTAQLVVAIDHHRGSIEHQPGAWAHQPGVDDPRDPSKIDTAPRFLENLAIAGVRDRVIPVIGSGLETLQFCATNSFELGFVDADHSEEATRAIGWAVTRCVKGLVVFHDCNDAPVIRAVESIARQGCYELEKFAGSLAGIRV